MKSSTSPKVSIIMSVYNTETFLDRSIKSVLNQTYKNFEFIIINNGSTDSSLSIINHYESIDNRIKLISNNKNKFLSEARNQALSISTGKYLYIIDSDDYIDGDTLNCSVLCAEENNLDLVVFGWYMEYCIDGKNISYSVSPQDNIFNNKDEFRKNVLSYLNQSILTVPWNKLYKREVINKYAIIYRNTKLEDHHFNMDYIQNIKNAAFISKPMYHYFRSRKGSELEQIYKFDLFKKKKEHYIHTKLLLEYWEINDEKNLTILYTFFAERILQCLMEINANDEFTKNQKRLKINDIFSDKEAKVAIKFSKPQSMLMRFMIMPLKHKNLFFIKVETGLINFIRVKHNKIFIKIKAKKVNKSKSKR